MRHLLLPEYRVTRGSKELISVFQCKHGREHDKTGKLDSSERRRPYGMGRSVQHPSRLQSKYTGHESQTTTYTHQPLRLLTDMLQRRQMNTVISGRGFLGLPQRGISFTSQPRSCQELSEPSANSSFDSRGSITSACFVPSRS